MVRIRLQDDRRGRAKFLRNEALRCASEGGGDFGSDEGGIRQDYDESSEHGFRCVYSTDLWVVCDRGESEQALTKSEKMLRLVRCREEKCGGEMGEAS